MTQIKSKKAKERIEYYSNDTDFIYPLTKEQIVEVVAIAEQQAEERHAKELQELKDKAVEAFCNRGQCFNTCPSRQCKALDSFTQKLNEK